MSNELQTLFSYLQAGLSERASLDWTTGLVRVNRTMNEFLAIQSRHDKSPRDREIVESLTHEHFHYFQICTSGYLYAFVLDWFDLILEMLPPVGRRRSLIDGTLVISDLHKEKAQSLEERLTRPGPEGVTVRAIVESGAFLAQKKYHYPNLTSQGYSTMLQAQGHDYKHAYEVAENRLGPFAFELYPMIAWVSLLAREPTVAFATVCRALADDMASVIRSGRSGLAVSADDLVVLLQESSILGEAFAVAHGRLEHPVYTDTVLQFYRFSKRNDANFERALCDPTQAGDFIEAKAMRPILFNKEGTQWPLWLPPSLWADLKKSERDRRAKDLIDAAAMAKCLRQAVNTP